MSCTHSHHRDTVYSKDVRTLNVDIDKLAHAIEHKSPTVKADKKNIKAQASMNDNFYKLPAMNEGLSSTLPWKSDANYFRKVYISAIALMKMTLHANSGGNIEVMGMITGKIIDRAIVVMDVYALPVEGTETRVNAQAEGYEYMVQFLEANKKLGSRNENIVGWYHSHPGYGCWLSGIDVSTQALNQSFQDPYLALVIDPTKTAAQNKVEIGAFRTYPEDYGDKGSNKNNFAQNQRTLPKSKRRDFGIHSDNYYSLDIEIFHNSVDVGVMAMAMKFEDNNSVAWMKHLFTDLSESAGAHPVEGTEEAAPQTTTGAPSKAVAKYNQGIINRYELEDENMNKVVQLVDTLQKWDIARARQHKNFAVNFESLIYRKLLKAPGAKTPKPESKIDSGSDEFMDERSEVSDDDESDLEGPGDKGSRVLDVSDMEDAVSVESSSVHKNDDDDDALEDDDDNDNADPLEISTSKKERRSFAEDVRRSHIRSQLLLPKDRERFRSQARSPVRSPKLARQENPGTRTARARFPARLGAYEDEHAMKLKKTGGRDTADLARLAAHVGQHELQTLVTADVQDRLFR